MRQLSLNGASFIQGFEKLCQTGYLDGGGIPTAGWGHTGGVVVGQFYPLAQCLGWFTADTAAVVHAVDTETPATLTQNQFDALVSFGFNVGITAEAHSTMMRLVQAGNLALAAAEFLKWNHQDGVVVDGLTRRREAEQTLFLAA